MEPKTWPTNQSWPVTQPEPTWDVFHLWPHDWKLRCQCLIMFTYCDTFCRHTANILWEHPIYIQSTSNLSVWCCCFCALLNLYRFFSGEIARPCGACVPFLAVIIFPFLVLFFVIFCAMSLVTGIFCSVPLSFGCCCLYSWRFSKSWQTDLYQKVIYLSYYFMNRGLPRPQVHPKFMPVDDMKPKQKLESLGYLGLQQSCWWRCCFFFCSMT